MTAVKNNISVYDMNKKIYIKICILKEGLPSTGCRI